ncbi:hypothetical protein JMN32_16560 [Fulvivirga sp. 29W222]|uniref:Uncharacterized protein n=1 Tax=Fulvivirga marina TaxID=2494733 RepID=A0A937G0V6_9BACT|nr:hypothetical protein [Fulvivirga marina]MBL6447930.1 hypothetical protein [Fulvivirga marina]
MNIKDNNTAMKIDSHLINRKEANEIIGTYFLMNKHINRKYAGTEPEPLKRTEAMYNKLMKDKENFNAFIFKKEDIEDFFAKGATHLMIVLGAHLNEHIEFPNFKKGSFTVVAAGCTKEETNGNETIYRSLNVDYPATEYPPKVLKETLNALEEEKSLVFVIQE